MPCSFASALNSRLVVSVALAVSIAITSASMPSFAQTGMNPMNTGAPIEIAQAMQPLQGYVVTVPAGSFVAATLQAPISSEFARPGDRFYATVSSPLSANGGIALPAGSQLEGQVVSATPAGRVGRNGRLDVRFTTAVTPSGQRVPLSARLQTDDNSGVLSGGTGSSAVRSGLTKAAIGAASGAALGTAMGALSGGEVGRGAIYGTALGGGLGAVYAASRKGTQAVIPAGQPLNIVLDSPLTVAPSSSAGNFAAPYQPAYPQGGYAQPQPAYNQPYAQPYAAPQQQQPYPGGYNPPYMQPQTNPY